MKSISILFLLFTVAFSAQTDSKIYDIIEAVSAERIKSDVKTLTEFGTRNTFSDTISNTQGIGAARRWIKSEFEVISNTCDKEPLLVCLQLVKIDKRALFFSK